MLLLKDGNVAWKLPADEALRHVKDLTACNIFPPQVTRAAYALKQRHVLPLTTSLPTTVAQGMEIFKALANESALTNEKVLANESTLSEEKGKAADTAAFVLPSEQRLARQMLRRLWNFRIFPCLTAVLRESPIQCLTT